MASPATQKKLLLIDCMALLYRSHFALHRHTRMTSKGMEVSALLGFANSLVDVLQKQVPTHVIATFDTPVPTWRQTLYSDYKIQREAQPEAISTAIPYSKRLLETFGIPYMEMPGYEADDVIGTLATQAAAAGSTVYIVSLDKDLGQLVNAQTSLYRLAIGGKPPTIWSTAEVLQHWGISKVTQIIDMISLQGDSSDNIPGVPGIGHKTAQKLLNQFNSLEEVLAQRDTLPPTLCKKLTTYEAQAKLSKKLATIVTDLPTTLSWTCCAYQGPDPKLLAPLLEELSFRSLAKRLLDKTPVDRQLTLFTNGQKRDNSPTTTTKTPLHTYAANKVTYQCVKDLPTLLTLVKKVKRQPLLCLDTETTGTDAQKARLLGISLAYQPQKAFYIPMPASAISQYLPLINELLSNPKQLKIGQNLKYDLRILQRHEVVCKGALFDTMIAHHLIAPGSNHGLNALARAYLHYDPIDITELIGPKGKGQRSMETVDMEQLTVYACEDADITLQLYHQLAPQLVKERMTQLFYEVEMKLLPILVKMEEGGVAIDQNLLAEASHTFAEEIMTLEQKIHDLAGETFNVDSPKQLGVVLFEKLQLMAQPIKTATGQYATSEPVLKKLTQQHPIIPAILDYRELKKLQSTYVDALPKLVGDDGRIHTSYHQGFVSTGRLSSSHPNLQNIPIRTLRGQVIRKAFVAAKPNHVLLSADYSQVELRIMAHFAQDQQMHQAFSRGQDIHVMTAAQVFQVNPSEVTSTMRRKAKMVNFGIIYGISAFGLGQRLAISRTEAKQIIDTYFARFPGVKHYMEEVVAQAKTHGYVTTLLGRKRFLPDINSRNATMRGFAERNAINMPIQGTAAELIQCAMISIDQWLQHSGLPAKMVLQVHDELLFETHQEAVPHLKKELPDLMTHALPTLSVPLSVTLGTGPHWLAAH